MRVVDDAVDEGRLSVGFPREPPGDARRHEQDAGRRQAENGEGEVAEPVDGCHHLSLIDFGDECPADRPPVGGLTAVDRDGTPRREYGSVAVVEPHGRSRQALVERAFHRRRIHLDLRVDDRGGHAEVGGKPGVAAEHPVGSDRVGLARLAHARGLPDDLVGPVDRDLKGDDSDHLPAFEERCSDEAGGRHEGGEVAGKLPVRHGIAPPAADGLHESVREAGADQLPAPQRGGEVGLLVHRVDDVARDGVDEKHVRQPVFLEDAPEQRMEGGMHLRVGGLVIGRIEEQL